MFIVIPLNCIHVLLFLLLVHNETQVTLFVGTIVHRLYSEADFSALSVATPPEMQRSDLAMAILQLKALGIDNVLRFNFPSPPPARNLHSALGLLYALGAIDSDGQLTEPLGIKMAEFPINPLYSKALMVSGKYPVSELEFFFFFYERTK
jgi:ATP-dependent RNA helicase DDX35